MMKGYVNSRNPILPPDIMIPDGEDHAFSDGRFYVCGSYDTSKAVVKGICKIFGYHFIQWA